MRLGIAESLAKDWEARCMKMFEEENLVRLYLKTAKLSILSLKQPHFSISRLKMLRSPKCPFLSLKLSKIHFLKINPEEHDALKKALKDEKESRERQIARLKECEEYIGTLQNAQTELSRKLAAAERAAEAEGARGLAAVRAENAALSGRGFFLSGWGFWVF